MNDKPKRSKTSFSLTTTLILAFLIVTVAALFVSGGLQLIFYIRSQKIIIAESQHNIAKDAAKEVSGFIQDKISAMRTMVWFNDPFVITHKQQKKLLEGLLGLQPAFRHLLLMDTQKEILSHASRLSTLVSVQITSRLAQILLVQDIRKVYFSPVYIDPATSEPLIIIAVPIFNVIREFQGSVIAEVNLKFMWDLVDRIQVGDTGKAYVVDRFGQLIAFSDPARVLKIENVGHLKAVSEFIRSPRGSRTIGTKIYYGITGELVVGTYFPLWGPDLAVVTELRWAEAYGQVIRIIFITIGIFLAIMVLAGMLGVYIARRLATPLVHLTETATQIASGGKGIVAPVSGPKEVVALTEAFGSMTQQLKQSYKGLEQQLQEIKKGEAALKESERRFRTLAEASFEGIGLIKQGILTDMNSQLADLLGYDRNEMIGTAVINYVAPEHRELVARSIHEDRIEPYEHLALRKNGTVFPVETRARSVDIESGTIRFSAIRDITDQKKAAETLRASEERLRNIVDNASEIIYTLSPEGIFTFVSPAWTRLLGHTVTEVLGRHFSFFVHPEDVAACGELLEKALITGQPQHGVEYRIKHMDGTWRWHLSVGSAVLDANGHPLYCVGMAQDITGSKLAEEEKARLEAQLFQAQKMESIGRLAGVVAHDFNNMLSVILGYIELIKLRSKPDDILLKDLNAIEKAATQARDVTRQLLAFSRKQIIAPVSININNLIRDKQETLARLIGEDIEFSFHPEKDIWNIRLDPSQFDQIIMNLVVNARDAMPEGGKLTIETGNVNISDEYYREHIDIAPGKYVLFSISDNGIGMDKDIQMHLFEPFFTTKEIGRGTGLGLATIFGIIKQNNGSINVYSEPGQGTTFRIYFPKEEAGESEAGEKAGKEEMSVSPATGLILLAEDNVMLRTIITALLEKIGYKVIAPETPAEVLLFCENNKMPVDLLITDVIMPGMNGKELRDRINAVKPGIKVLFMSGYTSNTIAHHGVLDDGVHFIQKPFNLDELAKKVNEAIKGRDISL
ncbi:MAG: PAS domain S-box protein [Spirochaetes bacterium]|nr:PAS domain S-box protein [Spirochaetota bacterium]